MPVITVKRLLSLGFALLLLGCDETLYEDLSQREANQIVSALRQAGIDAARRSSAEGLFSVAAPADDFAEAIAILERLGLPAQRFDSMADVFAGDGMLSSPLQERARLAYALSQELTQSLIAIDGVVDARVHLTLSRAKPLANEEVPATASVLLNHRPDFDVEAAVPDVKFLVAKAVPNLSYRDVTVVSMPQHTWPLEVQDVGAEPLTMGFGMSEGHRFLWMGAATLLLLSTAGAALAVHRQALLERLASWRRRMTWK